MKTQLTSNEKNEVKFTLTFTADEFENAIVDAYKQNKERFAIDGFRKGKAPRKMIENHYGEDIFWDEAINGLLQEHYPKAVSELDIEVIDSPRLELGEIAKGQDIVVTATVPVMPEVEVKDYFGVKVDGIDAKIDDAEVEEELKRVQKSQARMENVQDRKTEQGDMVVMDFVGSVDGVEFQGGSAENFELTLGSGQFIPGFEEQLVGKDAGEDVDVVVTFPEEYHAADLAGKEALFKCKIHEIKHETLPEINDELASDVSEFETLAEYKKDLKAKIQEQADAQALQIIKDSILQKIYDANAPEVPDVMIEDETDKMLQEMNQQLAYQGLDLEKYVQYMGQDMAGLRASARPDAERRVGMRLILKTIIKNENIEATDADVEQEIEAFGKQYGQSIDEVKQVIGDEGIKYFAEDVKVRKVIDLLYDNAKITAPKKASSGKKSDGSKAGDKKSTTKKAADKKPAAKKSDDKKPAAKKAPAKKSTEK